MDDRDRPETPELLSAAECAARTGLTVRALRVYEECGLIAPRRSAGGWRLYGPDELVKLNTVAMLKTAGLSLTQIRDVTRNRTGEPSLEQILEIQLGTWKTRRLDAERGEAITQAALERLRQHQSISVDELCTIIRSFEMSDTPSTPAPSQELEQVKVDPAVLERYVGFYTGTHGGEFGYHTVTRADGQLLLQSVGPPVDLYPISEREFTVKGTDVQITFVSASDGVVNELVVRQSGVELRATRIDAATAERISARLAERIANKTPVPGSEAALRRLSEGIRSGAPNYEEMSPAFAQVVQRQLPRLQPIGVYLGELKSIEFQGVGAQGWDCYDVHREHGTTRYRIALGSDGKILGALAMLISPVNLGP